MTHLPDTPQRPAARTQDADRPASGACPHVARELTAREWRTCDVYQYRSPKNRRCVTVIEPSRLALALELEFDPTVTDYIERPRMLCVDDVNVELCFWHRTAAGLEMYDLLISNKEATTHAVRRAERRTARIIEVASAAGLRLRVRKTSYCLTNRIANSSRIQLLPYVQIERDLPNAHALEQAIGEHFSSTPTSSFYAIERSLTAFRPHDVRAVVSALIHRGDLELDLTARLGLGSTVSRTGGAR